MEDIINNIIPFLNRELNIHNVISKYTEIDIVKAFIYDLSKVPVTVASLQRNIHHNDYGGMFQNYNTKIYLSSMKLIIYFDNDETVKSTELKIRKLDNIYMDSNHNIITCFTTIEKIIRHCIDNNVKLHKYNFFIRTIIYIIICNINDNFYSKNIIKYKIGLN